MGYARTLSYALALAIAAPAVPATAQTAQQLEGLWQARLSIYIPVATCAGHYNDWETGASFLAEFIPTQLLAAVEEEFPHQAPAKEPANEARDRGNEDGFGVRLVVVENPEEYQRKWEGPDIPKLESVSELSRGDSIGAFVVFSGCRPDAQGACDLEVDYTLYRPDGRVHVRRTGQPLWRREASPAPNLALGRVFLGFQPGATDLEGEYRVRARVSDRNAGIAHELERRFVVK
jgi:hypothetical protein